MDRPQLRKQIMTMKNNVDEPLAGATLRRYPATSFGPFTTRYNTGELKMKSTKDVIDHHLRAFAERDLKGVLSDYAPGAVFFTQHGALKGADEIGPLFQALIAEFAEPGAAFNMKQQVVEGDYAYILWTAETADNVYELGTDTFVVRDGQIIAQSFTGKIAPKSLKTHQPA